MDKELTTIPFRGMVYHTEDGVEIGSIVIRQNGIAFIAGNWCKQVSRKYGTRRELLDVNREHKTRLHEKFIVKKE